MQENRFVIKNAPFLRGKEDIKSIMWTVVVALLPTTCGLFTFTDTER